MPKTRTREETNGLRKWPFDAKQCRGQVQQTPRSLDQHRTGQMVQSPLAATLASNRSVSNVGTIAILQKQMA